MIVRRGRIARRVRIVRRRRIARRGRIVRCPTWFLAGYRLVAVLALTRGATATTTKRVGEAGALDVASPGIRTKVYFASFFVVKMSSLLILLIMHCNEIT